MRDSGGAVLHLQHHSCQCTNPHLPLQTLAHSTSSFHPIWWTFSSPEAGTMYIFICTHFSLQTYLWCSIPLASQQDSQMRAASKASQAAPWALSWHFPLFCTVYLGLKCALFSSRCHRWVEEVLEAAPHLVLFWHHVHLHPSVLPI